MKQPVEPPLTKTERAALTDLITSAAHALPTDSDRKRLIHLHRLDRADRKQERHTAGNVAFQLGVARADLAAAQARAARYRTAWLNARSRARGQAAIVGAYRTQTITDLAAAGYDPYSVWRAVHPDAP